MDDDRRRSIRGGRRRRVRAWHMLRNCLTRRRLRPDPFGSSQRLLQRNSFRDAFMTIFGEHGNIGPASVPIVLSKLKELGRLKKGDRIALLGIGSGLNCSMAEVEEEDSPVDEDSASEPKTNLIPFTSLQGYINYDTLKALTFKPFTLSAMSEVQKQVLSKMPYLAGGRLKGIMRQSEKDGELVENVGMEEDEEGMRRGREDLLVKAKTGTGKTIVS